MNETVNTTRNIRRVYTNAEMKKIVGADVDATGLSIEARTNGEFVVAYRYDSGYEPR